ncbi:MAG TPA: aquaporin [Anaerolineales bacterium]
MKPKALLAEFVGTFALIFVGAGTVAVGVGGLTGAALAHGFVIVSIAYSFGAISGAHLNPAVTLAVALRGRLAWSDALAYWGAQLAGSAAAAAALFFVLGGADSGLGATTVQGIGAWEAVVVEALLTFLLANVVLHTTGRKDATPFAGLAIGLTLAAGILMAGPLTGGALNPARTFGPALFTGTLGQFWIYVLGPGLGAALAAWVHSILKSKS